MQVLQEFPTELTLEGFRGFKKETSLRLTHEDGSFANWTILLGENGTGKTSLLQALVAMWPGLLVNRLLNNAEGSETLTAYQPDSSFFQREDFSIDSLVPKPALRTSLSFAKKKSGNARLLTVGANIFGANHSLSGGGPDISQWNDPDAMPLVCVYPSEFGRLQQQIEVSRDKILRDLIQFTTLGQFQNKESIGFLRHPDNWFLDLDHSIKSTPSNEFSNIDGFAKLMICELAPGLNKIEVKFDDMGRSPRIIYQTDLGPRYFEQLSNGYQRTITWLADFTSRMADYYSDLPGKWNAQPALCLIDEIDQHLHPAWQRTLLSKLAEKFPKTQFVATTHSPLIVQAVPDANFALLEKKVDDEGEAFISIDNSPENISGWRLDQIACAMFGSTDRDAHTEAIYTEHSALKRKDKLSTTEKNRLAKIDAELKNLPVWTNMEEKAAFEVLKKALTKVRAQ